MPDAPITLNDANLEVVLNGEKPVLILFTSGEGLRSDFKAAFDKAAKEGDGKIVYARVDPQRTAGAGASASASAKSRCWSPGTAARKSRAARNPGGRIYPWRLKCCKKPLTRLQRCANPHDQPKQTEEEEKPVTQPTVSEQARDRDRRHLRAGSAQQRPARAGRFLGGVVRPVPHGRPDPGEAGGRVRRADQDRQGGRRRQPRLIAGVPHPEHPQPDDRQATAR